MSITANISPFCLLNGTLDEQLFNYTQDELDDFHKVLQADVLSDVFTAVEQEYNSQFASDITLDNLSDEDCELLNDFIDQRLSTSNNAVLPPKLELLDGYIAISSSNLRTLDTFRDRLIDDGIEWEHRIKKHDGVVIHSYVFNTNEVSE